MQNREMIEACKQRDALSRQQEILFDISYYLGTLKVHEQDDLMDWLDGSRGLFAKIQEWAEQFDETWEKWKTAGVTEIDYITEIDDFSIVKWKALVAEFEADRCKVVGVQVVPVIDDRVGAVVAQLNGPTDETNGWAVYTRDPAGLAHWFADTNGEEQAMFIGGALANKHNVKIEAQLWKEQIDVQT